MQYIAAVGCLTITTKLIHITVVCDLNLLYFFLIEFSEDHQSYGTGSKWPASKIAHLMGIEF